MGIATRPTKIFLSLVFVGIGMCLSPYGASGSEGEKMWLDRLHLSNYAQPLLFTLWLKTGHFPEGRKISHINGYHVKTFYNSPYGQIQKADLVEKKGNLAFCFSPSTKGLYSAFIIMERLKDKTREIFISKQDVNGDNFWYGKPWAGLDKRKLNLPRLTRQVSFELVREIPKKEMQYILPIQPGNFITLRAYFHGEPQKGVLVTITTKEGWTKTIVTSAHGNVSFQLIRDNYKRKITSLQIDDFLVEATLFTAEEGKTTDGYYSQTQYFFTMLLPTFSPDLEIRPGLPALPLFFLTLVIVGIGIFIYRFLRCK